MALAEPGFRDFTMSLMPGVDNVLGVRLPKLRKLARELAKGDVDVYLAKARDDTFEEVMLQGMVIGYAAHDWDQSISRVECFVPKIGNWAVCDSFCGTLKFVVQDRARFWRFLGPYFKSEREYDVRFAAVMGLQYFLEIEYIEKLLRKLGNVKHSGYYAQMAVAWAISMAYVKFPVQTGIFLQWNHSLGDFTLNKAIQKICESKQVAVCDKEQLRLFLRK
jgi:3-methyladenine DNA glycosylase AlkD